MDQEIFGGEGVKKGVIFSNALHRTPYKKMVKNEKIKNFLNAIESSNCNEIWRKIQLEDGEFSGGGPRPPY